jgi:hypothetical protein
VAESDHQERVFRSLNAATRKSRNPRALYHPVESAMGLILFTNVSGVTFSLIMYTVRTSYRRTGMRAQPRLHAGEAYYVPVDLVVV